MLRGKRKIAAAVKALEQLGLPRAQQNQRSALTLLALLDLRPATPWDRAGSPSLGITPMMQFFAQNYGVEYAPNTRETVRRQTIHQFVQAGLVLDNPDEARPVNSPDYVYRIEPSTLELLRTYGSERWDENLAAYLATRETLQRKYAHEREMEHVPVTMATGERLELSSGSHSVLIKEVIERFCGYYTPGGEILLCGRYGRQIHRLGSEPSGFFRRGHGLSRQDARPGRVASSQELARLGRSGNKPRPRQCQEAPGTQGAIPRR